VSSRTRPRTPRVRTPGRAELEMVARDLRWTWHAGALRLFDQLDPDAWVISGRNPVRLLRMLGRSGLERAFSDPATAELGRLVTEDFAAYRSRTETWFAERYPEHADLRIAYFSAEFALTDALPIFAGGLGAVAGEILKSASALGVPVVGVGLSYRETSHQWLDADDHQQETWEILDRDVLPVALARDPRGVPVEVPVELPDRTLRVRVWDTRVGRSRLLLLDTDVPGNRAPDRAITRRLYGGDDETRIQQELVLGVGGYRALQALGMEPDVVHLNEGHSAFAALERIRSAHARDGLAFDEARAAASAGIVFTTHTPVAAGHDYFPPDLARRHLAPYAEGLGLDVEPLLALGRYTPDDPSDSFCPTVLGLRLAGTRNGVSHLHGMVTRNQWRGLWPRLPEQEVPVGHVTNGIHYQTWISPELDRLLHRHLGPRWRTTPGDPAMWRHIDDIDDGELWAAHEAARARLVAYTRQWLQQQLARRGAGADALAAAACRLDPDVLTIGFVGRFVAYKRPTLFLRDRERLARLLGDPERPVQIVFAGKAHPRDENGKALLREVVAFARYAGLEHRVVFLEDFDMAMDRVLSQGTDVWLNTPRRPLEACGIGGMKAGASGCLNLSTIDGWWDEAWGLADGGPPIGWCIGTDDWYPDLDRQDADDAESFYGQLERHIVPTFYERDPDGLPRRWIASMKQSMALLAPMWNSHRMVEEYTEQAWVPEGRRRHLLTTNGASGARHLARSIARLRLAWPDVAVRVESVHEAPGRRVEARIAVDLGGLDPDEVSVQLWVAPGGVDADAYAVTLDAPDGPAGEPEWPFDAEHLEDGELTYEGSLPAAESGAAPVIAARVIPRHPGLSDPFIPGLIRWS